MESTFGSLKNQTMTFDNFLGKFDIYKEELEQRERDLSQFLNKRS